MSHELGHFLGLGHVSDELSLMYPKITQKNALDKIDEGTLQGIRFLYGFRADFNFDGRCDFEDFMIFADSFGERGGMCDLDDSGFVDFQDFFFFAQDFQ